MRLFLAYLTVLSIFIAVVITPLFRMSRLMMSQQVSRVALHSG